jgi:hypothetical protein
MEKSFDLDVPAVGRGAQFPNHERLRDLAKVLLLRRFGLDFRGAFSETEQMSKSKLAATDQICVE